MARRRRGDRRRGRPTATGVGAGAGVGAVTRHRWAGARGEESEIRAGIAWIAHARNVSGAARSGERRGVSQFVRPLLVYRVVAFAPPLRPALDSSGIDSPSHPPAPRAPAPSVAENDPNSRSDSTAEAVDGLGGAHRSAYRQPAPSRALATSTGSTGLRRLDWNRRATGDGGIHRPSVAAGAACGPSARSSRRSPRLTGVGPCCGKSVDPSLPYCGHCGSRIDASGDDGGLRGVRGAYQVGARPSLRPLWQPRRRTVPRERPTAGTHLGDSRDSPSSTRTGAGDELHRPRRGGRRARRRRREVRLTSTSPLHARFEQVRDGAVGARPRLSHLHLVLHRSPDAPLGWRRRARRLAVLPPPARLSRPASPEADATRRMGSMVPSADIAMMEQLRADGSVRDTFHLSPARTVQLGGESGDWVFPYDPTNGDRHAEIRSQDAEFFVHDAGAATASALAVHGDRQLAPGNASSSGTRSCASRACSVSAPSVKICPTCGTEIRPTSGCARREGIRAPTARRARRVDHRRPLSVGRARRGRHGPRLPGRAREARAHERGEGDEPPMAADPDAIGRFNRQAANASRISHQNVARGLRLRRDHRGVDLPRRWSSSRASRSPTSSVGHGALPPASAAETRCGRPARRCSVAHDMGIVHRA